MRPTIQEALNWASLFLKQHNREEKVAELLLIHVLGLSRLDFLMQLQEQIRPDVYDTFKQMVTRHATTGIPLQHLTGEEQFYDRTFKVTKDTLIPRQETEELMYYLLKDLNKRPHLTDVVDVGTGTGVLAITLKLEQPHLNVYAVDISDAALRVAKDNANTLGALVTMQSSDFLSHFIETDQHVDVIVSNPPYIPYSDLDSLSDTVKNFDPHLALFSEEDGLYSYRTIIAGATHVLRPHGLMAFEIGHNQKEAVTALIKRAFPDATVETKQDMFGRDRMVFMYQDV
ncbi:release factor glutamine methyltransferase [Halolactibacillus miurensis]|uniref:Release factor glutamine methyltransferase n=1 Tax=Halolactibacillus miurensis TaxID=306541 RepID=A0A1I6PZL8_9BACI|nr:peptide chain release factor N(5)-glutamine methyltransferase [Halolactibacillus miurensis]GEM05352.1 release factor glutamine methyltransferase [Halolactibacillus miurensis]SFS45657.1 release factor glutamine methyltransferase [Halolactibacillus miurensis]